jgi:hypothetical protein
VAWARRNRREWTPSRRASALLADQFSGGYSKHQGNVEPERLGGFAVDDEFELGGLLHRQVRRLRGALEDVISPPAATVARSG